MKSEIAIYCFLIVSTSALVAQTSLERELQQLSDQREKAIKAATEPINQKYQSALEQLLRRASQARDIATSEKILEALKEFRAGAELPQSVDKTAPGRASKIEKLLTNSVWLHGGFEHFTFTKGGRVVLEEQNRKGRFKIDGQTGFVALLWDGNKPSGEGLQFQEESNTFKHNKGRELVPVAKK